jgi:predicted GNAT family N-acyltransferase
MSPAFTVRAAHWEVDETTIARLRRQVFIEEQGVPEALEWEASDPACQWFLACFPDGEAIGVARLTPQGRVGRMAVAKTWRRLGVGGALLAAAVAAARARGLTKVVLAAQRHAIPFYERHGFRATGPEFPDAGIPHRTMTLALRTDP